MTRVIFMGTPDFSVPTLQMLFANHYDVVAVVTQPDRPAGRGRQPHASPVKRLAMERGVQVLQPHTLRADEIIQELASLMPDVIVVAAYGLILPPRVLSLPQHGCVNVHASLLPRHRGASPITAAILAGDTVTGSTIMLMDEGMDTGPILAQEMLPIAADHTTETLSNKLAQHGAELLAKTLPRWLRGEITPHPQDEGAATYCKLVKKEDGRIDWQRSAVEIERAVRAYQPWPSAYTTWQGKQLKILRAHIVPGKAEPGRVVAHDLGAAVGTGYELLALDEVQLAGKRALPIREFLNGQPAFRDALLR